MIDVFMVTLPFKRIVSAGGDYCGMGINGEMQSYYGKRCGQLWHNTCCNEHFDGHSPCPYRADAAPPPNEPQGPLLAYGSQTPDPGCMEATSTRGRLTSFLRSRSTNFLDRGWQVT